MRHLNLPSSKRNTRQWRLFDLVSAAFFGAVLLFFLFVFTPFGDSVAASRRQPLVLATAETRQRQKLVALIEAGQQQTIGICPAEAVDHMPCEDPRRNSQLSREMNFYRERQCPLTEETPLCLIPPPAGYRIPVQWPESLHKIEHILLNWISYFDQADILLSLGPLYNGLNKKKNGQTCRPSLKPCVMS